MNKKVLIIGNYNSIYIRKLLESLSRAGDVRLNFYVLSGLKYIHNGLEIYALPETKNSLRKLINTRKIIDRVAAEHPDIVHIHYFNAPTILYVMWSKLFRKGKLVVTFWGSDLYRISGTPMIKKIIQKSVIKRADVVTVTSEKMIDDFYKIFDVRDKKVFLTKFAVPIDLKVIDQVSMEEIEKFKKRFSIAANNIVLTLGYSADPGKNHMYMIDEVVKLYNTFKNIFVFLPMTYGNVEHREKVKQYCEEKFKSRGIKYSILEEQMSDREVAVLRKATDIMVNVQVSDALSASMQESLYAGSIVINGEWLDYSELKREGAYFETIPRLGPGLLSSKIAYVIENLYELKEKTVVNKKIIAKRCDWEEVANNFLTIYDNLLESTM
ncbi:MAG: glycosyltransferase family 4 protein [Fervidobacterium gondwanense]